MTLAARSVTDEVMPDIADGDYTDWISQLDHYATKHGAIDKNLQEILTSANHLHLTLGKMMAYSPYLSGLMHREADAGLALLTQPLKTSLEQILQQASDDIDPQASADSVAATLRKAKTRAHLVIALGDFSGLWRLRDITLALSLTADHLIQLATRHLLWQLAAAGKYAPTDMMAPERGSGLVILAMGKLGAGELNYSSDVDLIAFYDPAATPIDRYDAPQVFTRLARDLINLLEKRTGDGYVFRADLRLRPDPASTPLAVSTTSAIAYYHAQALNWERAAMIKARPVIADPPVARSLMETLGQWVWRAGSDFTAIEDMEAVKRKIDLKQQRHQDNPWHGYNVKLDRGGIRQLEFFAQGHQLLFAGQQPGLRIMQTLDVLDELVRSSRMTPMKRDRLTDAYIFLRTVEHRLQMQNDQQTHSLPVSDEGIAAVAASMGQTTTAFLAALKTHTDLVAHEYQHFFNGTAETDDADSGEAMPSNWQHSLSAYGFADLAKSQGIITDWLEGKHQSTRSDRARDLLKQVLPVLLSAFGKAPDPDQVLLRFDGFLSQLSAGVPVFSLIKNSPRLPQLFASILGFAPALADLVTRRPNLLDAVLDPQVTEQLPDWSVLEQELSGQLSVAGSYEDCLDICRRWTARRRFQAALHLLDGKTPRYRVGQFLARVAEISLTALAPIVIGEFERQHGHFPGGGLSIIAMGNLASGQITLTSDLDLVLVYRVDPHNEKSDGKRPLSPNEYWIKLASRLVTAITSLTSEGRMYEVDLRLRPQGNSGPLAVSLESFAQYQDSDAWTWEHMALTRARVISGDIDLRAQVERIIFQTLTAQRDPDRLLRDVADMSRRLRDQHSQTDIWQLKHHPGGITDIQFIAQYLLLRHAHAEPGILSASTTAALERCKTAGFIETGTADDLIAAYSLYRRIRSYLRLIAPDGTRFDPASVNPTIRDHLARIIQPDHPEDAEIDFDAATADLSAVIDRTEHHFKTIIINPASALPPPDSQ